MFKLDNFLKSRSASFLLPFITTILLLAAWEIIVQLLKIKPFTLPAPSAIYLASSANVQALLINASQTLFTTILGFILAIAAGALLVFLIGYSKLAYLTLYPILVGFNTVPKVALVPLFALWFGIGTIPAVLTALIRSA